MSRIDCLFFSAFLLASSGCVSNWNHLQHASLQLPPASCTQQQVERGILDAAAARGWNIDSCEPGSVKASITRNTPATTGELSASVTARLVISYSDTAINLGFAEDGQQLKANTRAKFNHWLKILAGDLKRKFNNSVLVRS